METFAIIFWIGGVMPAYHACRSAGKSKFWSTIGAVTWPLGFGAWVAARYFDPHA